MDTVKAFVRTSVLGGLAFILPTVLLFLIFRWLFYWITDIIQPISNLIIAKGQYREFVADVLAIAIIVAICFFVGVIIKTKIGKFIRDNLEDHILNLAPGYATIKAVVMQFIGRKKSPFSSVALVQVFGSEIMMTSFITETHDSGWYTVFVPTGPNPTSGLIFHAPPEYVHPVAVSVEETIRSVIGCGAGSAKLFDELKNQRPGL